MAIGGPSMPAPHAATRSLLAHYLALVYGLAIAYSSLQPFAPWIAPAEGTPFFLLAQWPPRWTRFDVIANALAYLPFGVFLALVPYRRPARTRILTATLCGALLSLAMEASQMFLPPRDASAIDLVANTGGAAVGGAIGSWLAQSARAGRALIAFRVHWFLRGKVGDFGLALLAIWLVVQLNPGIALFATTFDPDFQIRAPAMLPAPSFDIAGLLIAAANSAFQLLGVGLFLTLLLRQRRHVGGAVLLLIVTAMLIKGVAAAVLLKPAAWEHWLSPGVPVGVAVGALLLLMAIGLPRPAQVILATIALLSSMLTPLLTPDVVFARAPLWAFDWSYGHLLNFNGLTHTVLLLWPIAASIVLFALAARPDWGEPE
jgi:VanZ family protein